MTMDKGATQRRIEEQVKKPSAKTARALDEARAVAEYVAGEREQLLGRISELEQDYLDLHVMYTDAVNKPSAGVDERVPDEVFQDQFQAWWDDEGQYCRVGGTSYERSFAFQAWRHLYPMLMQARAQLAAPSGAPASDVVRVPLELANRLTSTDNHVRQTARRELRNMLLNGGRV